MLFFKKKKKADPPAVDSSTLQRLGQIRDLYMESGDILAKTTKLSTFLSRYEDARRFIGQFNDLMIATGQSPIVEMYNDVDQVFVGRLGEVVAAEVAEAESLRTDKGQRDRLERILQILEGFDRPDDGPLDDVIMDAEDKIFRILGQGIDWEGELDADGSIGISEENFMKILTTEVVKYAKAKGFSDVQIKKILNDVFGK